MGVLQVLNAHKSFLENVQNLGILKKKAVVSSGLQDKPLNVVLEKWGVTVICKAKAFRTTRVPGRSEIPWHICLSCTDIRIVNIWRAKTSNITWKSWQTWTSWTSSRIFTIWRAKTSNITWKSWQTRSSWTSSRIFSSWRAKTPRISWALSVNVLLSLARALVLKLCDIFNKF